MKTLGMTLLKMLLVIFVLSCIFLYFSPLRDPIIEFLKSLL